MLLAFAFWAFIGEEVTPGALLAAALALPAAFALTLDFAFTLALAFAFGAAVSKYLSQLMGQFLLEKPVLQILVLVQVEAKCKHSIRWTSRPLHEVTNRGDKWHVTSILSTSVLHRWYMQLGMSQNRGPQAILVWKQSFGALLFWDIPKCTLDVNSSLSPKVTPWRTCFSNDDVRKAYNRNSKDLVNVSINQCDIYNSQWMLHGFFIFIEQNLKK